MSKIFSFALTEVRPKSAIYAPKRDEHLRHFHMGVPLPGTHPNISLETLPLAFQGLPRLTDTSFYLPHISPPTPPLWPNTPDPVIKSLWSCVQADRDRDEQEMKM